MGRTHRGRDAATSSKRGGDGVTRRRAVVIGIDHYLDPSGDLPHCANDAIRVAAALQARGFEVTALHDGDVGGRRPTRKRVLAALARVTAASDADDLILVYASCHGTRVAGRPYLLMADTPGGDAAIETHGLALAAVLAELRGRSRWVAVLLDACHMGLGLDPTVGRSTAHCHERAGSFALLAGSTSAQITQDAVGAGGADGNGIFSRHVIAALEGGAVDAEGGLRFSALARYVQAGVERWRASDEGKLARAQQVPVVRLEVADLQLFPARGHLDLAPRQPAAIECATFSRDGLGLITGGADGSMRIWDPRTGAARFTPRSHDGPVIAVAASDWGIVSTATRAGVVKNWQLATSEPLPPDAQLGVTVHGLVWGHGAARTIAVADGVLIQTGTDLATGVATPYRIGEVLALALCDGGFVSGGADGRVCQWAIEQRTGTAIGRHDGPVSAIAISPDGRYVAAGGDGPDHARPDLAQLWHVERRDAVPLPGHGGAVTAISFAPDGASVATACADGLVRIFDVPRGQLARTLAIEPEAGTASPAARCLCHAPDGGRLFVGYADGRGRLFTLNPS